MPNATVIVIDNADRFGLSQLHQLRAESAEETEQSFLPVDRRPHHGKREGAPWSDVPHDDGFEIAEMDLAAKRPWRVLRHTAARIARVQAGDVGSELELLALAKEDALALLQEDPRLITPAHKHLRAALLTRFGQTMALAQGRVKQTQVRKTPAGGVGCDGGNTPCPDKGNTYYCAWRQERDET